MGINLAKIQHIKNGKPFSVLDIVAILLALIISLGYIVYILSSRTQGEQAEITVNGGGTYVYSLSQDRTITNEEIGIKENFIIVIKDNKIYVSHSDCNNHICLKMGAIMYKGQSITCLPLGVHIRILGGLNLVVG